VPNATVIACLINPVSPRAEGEIQQLQVSSRSLGLNLKVVSASSEGDLETAFPAMVKAGATALFVASDPSYNELWEQITLRAIRYGIPTMFPNRQPVVRGALMSYDASLVDSFRQAGVYVGRVLKGEKPADLPVLQPMKFELVINLKIAKVLGLELPASMLVRANEVIE
jgi:ABC-type uncharacterized transport system substrate-binding protein